jgi:hypothetical protein
MLDRPNATDFDQAQTAFEKALGDLDQDQTVLARDDARGRALCDSFRAGAQIGLGLVAVRQGRRDVALEHHHEAQRLIDQQTEETKNKGGFRRHKDLNQKLNEQIESMPPRTLSAAR